MSYYGASVNESPLIAAIAGADITSGDFLAVKFSSGKAILCATAGEPAFGFLLPGTGDAATGDDVTVQIKDIGMAKAGGTFAVGDPLTVDASAQVVKAATAKDYIIGYALEAGADGTIVRIQITKSGYVPAA